MGKYVLGVMLLLLLGCEAQGEKVPGVKESYGVVYLFEVDGCKVYRFNDGRSVWFTTCPGQVGAYHGCGKGCSRYESTVTTQ